MTGGAPLNVSVLAVLARAGIDAQIVADVAVVSTRDEPPALDVDDMLARVKGLEPVKDRQERDFDYHDERRGDPQRDVAMLRREMLARERSNRHMLKGKGRR